MDSYKEIQRLQAENERLRNALLEIKKEVNDDITLGYHRWINQVTEIALEQSTIRE